MQVEFFADAIWSQKIKDKVWGTVLLKSLSGMVKTGEMNMQGIYLENILKNQLRWKKTYLWEVITHILVLMTPEQEFINFKWTLKLY